jgi:hypothetical protein
VNGQWYDTRENSTWALKGTQLSHLNAKPLTVLMGSKSPGPTILILCSCVFNDLALKLSNLIPRLDKRCSPSALDEFRHRFARHALAVGRLGVALDLTQRCVAGDCGNLVRRASDLGEAASGRFTQAMR